MTARYYALTVALAADTREDDAQALINAIKQMKGVVNVAGNVATPETWTAESRVRQELGVKLMEVLYPK